MADSIQRSRSVAPGRVDFLGEETAEMEDAWAEDSPDRSEDRGAEEGEDAADEASLAEDDAAARRVRLASRRRRMAVPFARKAIMVMGMVKIEIVSKMGKLELGQWIL